MGAPVVVEGVGEEEMSGGGGGWIWTWSVLVKDLQVHIKKGWGLQL